MENITHLKLLKYAANGSRTIAPEENCLTTTKLTLSQTLTLTGDNFSRGQLSGYPLTLN